MLCLNDFSIIYREKTTRAFEQLRLFIVLIILEAYMAEILLAAGALYLGYKAAGRVRSAYTNTKSEMYAEQDMMNYYQPSYQYSQPYSGRSHGSYYPSNGYGGGSSYRSGYSYGYR